MIFLPVACVRQRIKQGYEVRNSVMAFTRRGLYGEMPGNAASIQISRRGFIFVSDLGLKRRTQYAMWCGFLKSLRIKEQRRCFVIS